MGSGGVPTSNFLKVGFVEALPIPTVGSVIIGRTSIDVKGLTIGASVELVVTAKDGVVKEVNLFVAADEPSTAHLQNPIADGDRVKALRLLRTLTALRACPRSRIKWQSSWANVTRQAGLNRIFWPVRARRLFTFSRTSGPWRLPQTANASRVEGSARRPVPVQR
jgi:hypothetical protein